MKKAKNKPKNYNYLGKSSLQQNIFDRLELKINQPRSILKQDLNLYKQIQNDDSIDILKETSRYQSFYDTERYKMEIISHKLTNKISKGTLTRQKFEKKIKNPAYNLKPINQNSSSLNRTSNTSYNFFNNGNSDINPTTIKPKAFQQKFFICEKSPDNKLRNMATLLTQKPNLMKKKIKLKCLDRSEILPDRSSYKLSPREIQNDFMENNSRACSRDLINE